jgi:hypothetical protein
MSAAIAGELAPAPSQYGARVVGPALPAQRVSLELFFQPRATAGLQAAAMAVSAPGNASYHRYMTVTQFRARYGPPPARVAALDGYLRRYGATVGSVSANGLAQGVTGTARELGRALGTGWETVRTSSGHLELGMASAPRLPRHLAAAVSYVDGVAPWVVPHDNLVRFPARRQRYEPAGAAAGNAPGCAGMAGAGMTPAQMATAFDFGGFYQHGDQGQGQTIGLVEYALADTAAIAQYQSCAGSDLAITYDPSASPPHQKDPEVAADIEVIAALAPRASVVVYEADQSGTGLSPWEMAVSGTSPGGLPSVISSSWGACEAQTGMGPAYYSAEETLFEEAALQGQTVLVATGDDGSEGCHSQDSSNALQVDDPASAPMVTAVGGTSSTTLEGPQTVWNSRNASPADCLGTGCPVQGSSGGGESRVWAMPSYQATAAAGAPGGAGHCKLGAGGCRELPDVSALAGDPYSQYCSGSVCGGSNSWVSFGGTSLATPSWAAAVALSVPLCVTRPGFLNSMLYQDPTAFVGRVTAGDNDLTGSQKGLYPASAAGSYSMATGLGYLGGVDLSGGALCGPGNIASSAAQGQAAPTTTLPGPYQPQVPAAPRACSAPKAHGLAVPAVALVAVQDGTGCAGYWVADRSGQVAAFGSALGYGSLVPELARRSPVVAMAASPDDGGYWLLQADGHLTAFGDASLHGQPSAYHLSSPAVGLAVTPSGLGYWVATRDGGVLALGDAQFYGSLGARHLSAPVVGIVATRSGKGYRLVSADGGVFAFGDATYDGPLAHRPPSPVVGMVPGGTHGYRLADRGGNVYALGASYLGGLVTGTGNAITAVAPSIDRGGYYLLAGDGAVYAFGDAPYLGGAAH